MNLTKASRYGLYAVVMMCERPDELINAALVAKSFGVSENHVAKVLQQLGRQQIVKSVRGARGGYQLATDPRRLTMLDIIEALEGPMSPGHRGDEEPRQGEHLAASAIQGVLEEIDQQAYFTMKSVTIATLLKRTETLQG
jgi:Rrf2 family protein